jgi:hypothetical protein
VLETALELLIIAEHHIEYLLVLTLAVYEPLQPFATHLDLVPGALPTLAPDLLITLGVVQVELLLLEAEGDLGAVWPRENTAVRICVLQVPELDILSEHAIIWQGVPENIVDGGVVLMDVATLSVEIFKAKVVIVIAGASGERLLHDNPKVAHLQYDLIANVVHDFSDGLRDHLLQDFWLGLDLVGPAGVREELQ